MEKDRHCRVATPQFEYIPQRLWRKNHIKYQENIQGIICFTPELNTGDIPSAGRQQFSLLPKCIFPYMILVDVQSSFRLTVFIKIVVRKEERRQEGVALRRSTASKFLMVKILLIRRKESKELHYLMQICCPSLSNT